MTPTLEARCRVRNPFEGRDAEADEERTIAPPEDELVKQLVAVYDTAVFKASGIFTSQELMERFEKVISHLQAPTPAQINGTFGAIRSAYPSDGHLGRCANALLRRSYDSGHRSFVIHTQQPEDYLLADFAPKERVRLEICGDVGEWFDGLKNCDVTVTGDVLGCGANSEECTYTIMGDAAQIWRAQNTTFAVHGNVGEVRVGEGCVYEFHGRIPQRVTPSPVKGECTVRVPSQHLEAARQRFRNILTARVEVLP